MLNSHIMLAAGWIIFCVLHSVFASVWFKKWICQKLPSQYRFFNLYYTIFAFLFFIFILIDVFTIDSPRLFDKTIAVAITGWTVTTAGVIIMVVCIFKYFVQLSGIKALIGSTKKDKLMITGIHHYVRHPLYTGTFLFIWGLLLLHPYLSLLIVNIIITTYTLIGIGFEEKKLEQQFGEDYKSYKSKTPMIIPRLKKTS